MHVLVSGAGIAGCTLAWWLSKLGARVRVIEKSHNFLAQGQNIEVSDSALLVVKKMGLWDKILQHNTTEKGTQFIDRKGRPFAKMPMVPGYESSPTSELEILRSDLAAVLFEASKELPNVEYKFNTTIEKIVANDEDSVKVELNTGEVEEYDVLVAADGQWSKTRQRAFKPEDVKVVDKDMYIVYGTIPGEPGDDHWWNVYHALGSRILSSRPDSQGTTRAMVSIMPQNEVQRQTWQSAIRSDRKTQMELLEKEFEDVGWQKRRFLDGLAQAPDFYFQAIQQIRMSKWSNSRVICLGDAAYAPTPLTGAGATLSISGAYSLAGELGNLKNGEHPSRAFEAYEKAFRPLVEDTQDIPSFVPAIMHPATAPKRWLLQTFISAFALYSAIIMKIPFFRKYLKQTEDKNNPLQRYPAFDRLEL